MFQHIPDTNAALETTMAMRYGGGIPVATAWEGDYDIDDTYKQIGGTM